MREEPLKIILICSREQCIPFLSILDEFESTIQLLGIYLTDPDAGYWTITKRKKDLNAIYRHVFRPASDYRQTLDSDHQLIDLSPEAEEPNNPIEEILVNAEVAIALSHCQIANVVNVARHHIALIAANTFHQAELYDYHYHAPVYLDTGTTISIEQFIADVARYFQHHCYTTAHLVEKVQCHATTPSLVSRRLAAVFREQNQPFRLTTYKLFSDEHLDISDYQIGDFNFHLTLPTDHYRTYLHVAPLLAQCHQPAFYHPELFLRPKSPQH